MVKKKAKRVLSVLMALVMILTVIPMGMFSVLAASSKAGDNICPDLNFWTPEAIYLYPNGSSWTTSTSTPFQYYINNNEDGSVKPGYEESGYIYYSYPYATNTSVSARFIDSSFNTISGGTIAISNKTPGTGATIIISGSSPSIAASSNGCWIEWTLSFTDSLDGKTKKAYSYTYVYKPYVVPVGGFVRVCNERYSNSYAQSITWISGVHSITVGTLHDKGGYYPNYGGSKGFSAFITKGNYSYYGSTLINAGKSKSLSNCTAGWSGHYEGAEAWNLAFMNGNPSAGPYFQTSASNTGSTGWGTSSSTEGFNVRSMDYWYKDTDAENLLVNLTSGASGNITIDTSRYTNLKQIPNLAGGLMVTDDEASDEGGHWLVGDASGITNGRDCDYWTGSSKAAAYLDYKNYAIARQGANSRTDWGNGSNGTWEEEGVKYAGAWPRTLLGSTTTQGGKYMYTWMGWYGNNDDGTDFSFNRCTVDLNATYHNKAKLRAAVETTIKKMPALGVTGISTGTISSCYFDANTNYKWTALQTAYKAAVLALGQLDTTANCDTLASNLTNALNALCTKVTLSANGGSMSGTASQYITIGTSQAVSVTPKNWSGYTAPTRTGYTFGGWTTNSSSTTGADTVKVGYNNTLYAAWNPNKITLTYDGNGFTYGTLTGEVKFDYGVSMTTAPQLKREYTVSYDYNGATGGKTSGTSTSTYVWNGWKSNKNSKTYDASTSYSDCFGATSGTVMLTAQWIPTAISLPSPTKTGYTFAGWYTSASGGTKIGDGGSAYTPTSNMTLYAQWTANKYYLNLNGTLDSIPKDSLSGFGTADVYINGALVSDDCIDYYSQWDYGTAYTIKDIKVAEGYTYEGSSTISGTIGAQDTSVALRFHTNTYSIIFNGNGSTGGSTATMKGIKWGENCQLNANGFTREGYDFAGWASSSTGDVIYGDNAVVNTLSGTDNGTVTLYAKWVPKNDRVYKLNVYLMNTMGAYPSTPETFTFPGQTTGNTVSVDYAAYIPAGKDASQFFLDQSKTNVISGQVLGNNGLTLVVYIGRKSHTVTYNFAQNGGSYASETSATLYYDADVNLAPTAVKLNWTFVGWNTFSGDTTGATVKSLKMGTGDIVLYAVFSCTMKIRCYYIDPMKSNARTYTETFATIYNGADTIAIPTYDGVPEYTTNFNDTLCTFKGYTTGTVYSGNEALIGAGDSITFNSSAGFANDKLMGTYCGCYDMTVELNHDAMGGVLSAEDTEGTAYLITLSSKFSYSTAKIPTQSAATRDGYTFVAWARTPDAEQSKYIEAGKELSLYSNTTVYAIWLKNWDSEDEAHRQDAEKSADVISGVKINADGTVSTISDGTVYKYANYSDSVKLYNSYVSALNTYNSNSGSLKFIALKALETALKNLRAHYENNINPSDTADAVMTYLNGFTVSYASGAKKLAGIEDGTHTLAEMNLNHYSFDTLDIAMQAKSDADSMAGKSYKAFEMIDGTEAQTAINSAVERMAKSFVNVEKVDAQAGFKIYESPSAVADRLASANDIDAVNYVASGKDGYTYYCYTNKQNPTVVIDISETGSRACYPIKASVSGGMAAVNETTVLNSVYDTYLANGIGTAHEYNKKDAVVLTPSFTADNQMSSYTIKAYDDAYSTSENDRNYAGASSLSEGIGETEAQLADNALTIVICYKSDDGFNVTGDTWENEDELRDDFSLYLNGADASELAKFNDSEYAVLDPQYGRANYGSFVYFFIVGESNSAENCTLTSADCNTAIAFFSDKNNFNSALAKGYSNAAESNGLGFIQWTAETGAKLTSQPADNAYAYVHMIDKWGNAVDKVIALGKFTYSAVVESFELVNTATYMNADGINYAFGFKTLMTKSQLADFVECEGTYYEVETSNSRYLGTGSVIRVYSEKTDELLDEYVIIVYGDVDGNARVDFDDASVVELALSGEGDALEGASKLAANVYGSRATINTQDAEIIRDAATGFAVIDQVTGKAAD